MLILQPDRKKAILNSFKASLEGQNFLSSQREALKGAKNDNFYAKIAYLLILTSLNGISMLILQPDPKKAMLETF